MLIYRWSFTVAFDEIVMWKVKHCRKLWPKCTMILQSLEIVMWTHTFKWNVKATTMKETFPNYVHIVSGLYSQELSCIEVRTTKVRWRFWVLFEAPSMSRASPDLPFDSSRLTLVYDSLPHNPLILFFSQLVCFVSWDLIEN